MSNGRTNFYDVIMTYLESLLTKYVIIVGPKDRRTGSQPAAKVSGYLAVAFKIGQKFPGFM